MILQSLEQILEISASNKPKRLIVSSAEELHVLEAVKLAFKNNIISPILVGNIEKIKNIASSIDLDLTNIPLISENDPIEASKRVVSMIKNKEADILMKGMVSTSILLKAVLDHKIGIKKGKLLSHIAICQINTYHKLLTVTDAAINIAPNLEDKIHILSNALELLHKLGYSNLKIAIVCPVEKENAKIESTVHASKMKQLNQAGEIKNCIIDGPLALDNIISKEAAMTKSINSEVAGDADLILAPNLDSGNILYKSIIFLARGYVAAVVSGASVPIVLTSRADSEKSKLYSIALSTII